MKWAYGIRRKISAAMLLAAIFVLLFVKSMMESSYVNKLGDSFSSVYEDRLVVASYIYRISDHLFRKKIMIDSAVTPSSLSGIKQSIYQYNQTISDIVQAYEKTELTEAEHTYFQKFKTNVRVLIDLETSLFSDVKDGLNTDGLRDKINRQFDMAFANLDQLSGIQTSEGKLLNESSQRIVAGSSILTYLEIGILIAVGLMVFVLVFESSAIFSKSSPQKRHFN